MFATRGIAVIAAAFGAWTQGVLLGFLAGLGQDGFERVGGNALQGAEVGGRQAGGVEIAQQLGAVATLLLGLLVLLLGCTVLLARFAVGLALSLDRLFTAGLGDGAAARQLVGGHLAVFFGQLAGRLAVQVETLGALRHSRQVGRGARVATEEGRQGLLAELAGGALLDVDLDAQLERLGRPLEQGGEQLGQTRAGGGGRDVGLGRGGLGCGRVSRGLNGRGVSGAASTTSEAGSADVTGAGAAGTAVTSPGGVAGAWASVAA